MFSLKSLLNTVPLSLSMVRYFLLQSKTPQQALVLTGSGPVLVRKRRSWVAP